MKFGFRAPDSAERHPQRVLIWKSGTTTDVKVVGLTGGALAVVAGSVKVAATHNGLPRVLASAVAVLAASYGCVLLSGLLVSVAINRLLRAHQDDPDPREQ